MLAPVRQRCPGCGGHMRLRYENRRNLVTLSGAVRLRLRIRRCEAPGCARFHAPYRPEAEGALALPQHEFGLDVIALVGVLRHRGHRSVPEIHAALRGRGLDIAERSVTNLLDRYDELLATRLTGARRLRRVLKGQGGVILALDGLQPDVCSRAARSGCRRTAAPPGRPPAPRGPPAAPTSTSSASVTSGIPVPWRQSKSASTGQDFNRATAAVNSRACSAVDAAEDWPPRKVLVQVFSGRRTLPHGGVLQRRRVRRTLPL